VQAASMRPRESERLRKDKRFSFHRGAPPSRHSVSSELAEVLKELFEAELISIIFLNYLLFSIKSLTVELGPAGTASVTTTLSNIVVARISTDNRAITVRIRHWRRRHRNCCGNYRAWRANYDRGRNSWTAARIVCAVVTSVSYLGNIA